MSTKQERVTLRHIFDEIVKIFNLEKGIFLTIRDLWIKPGVMIRQYMNGERERYIRPIQFAMVLVGIYTFLVLQKDWNVFEADSGYFYNTGYKLGSGGESIEAHKVAETTARLEALSKEIMVFFRKYLNLLMLAIIPYVAFFTYLFYKKRQWNYAEHLVLNSYLTGAQSAIYILLFPLVLVSSSWYSISSIFAVMYNIWFYQQAFNDNPKEGWGKAFWIVLLLTVIFLILFFIVGVIWALIKLS